MNTFNFLTKKNTIIAGGALVFLLALFAGASFYGSWVQTDFGNVLVENVWFQNEHGTAVRGKLFRHQDATPSSPMPGIVFIHGYQSNRETGDAIAIELSRRGVVVLSIDVIGRGNSGTENDPRTPKRFDPTFGGTAAVSYFKGLPFVDAEAVSVVGHSLGAQKSYQISMNDPSIRSVVLIGFAYKENITAVNPKNMLMIFGDKDEFRRRMTGVADPKTQWMHTPQTKNAFGFDGPEFGKTYGDFDKGTARRVALVNSFHVEEPHQKQAVAETLTWIQSSLQPNKQYWKDPSKQIWFQKETASLVAMLAGFAVLIPLALLFLKLPFFSPLLGGVNYKFVCSPKEYAKHFGVNTALNWLYIPCILMIFGLHKYVVNIDPVFPMMVVNAIVWWFFFTNIIGFFLFKRWAKQKAGQEGLSLYDLGISFSKEKFALDWAILGKTAGLAVLLFGCLYGLESVFEWIFIVDFRFFFAFASDLTPYRWLMFLLYLPFLFVGFLQLGIFLYCQARPAQKETFAKTVGFWTGKSLFTVAVPLIVMALWQYGPLLLADVIPLTGPGDVFVLLFINLTHILCVLCLVIPVSTWLFQLTGRPYLGAMVSACIVAWMLTSSQVIAPIPN